MASLKLALSLFFILFVLHESVPAKAQLKVGFYDSTCPQAESIIKEVTNYTFSVALSLAGPLLRMHFHDCFVRGCDGSVLINSATNASEKFAAPNLSLRGFQIIDKIKTALEKKCPGIVSCADIVAYVARDAVLATKGKGWNVEAGRRDGTVSNRTEALFNLPPPFANITVLKNSFGNKGLSVKDLVVLSGGHTIGTSHCPAINNRLYNFTGVGDSDPALDSEYAVNLRKKCVPNDQTTLIEMDPGSFKTFDVNYFELVTKRRGLFQSDSALLNDPETSAYVLSHNTDAGKSSFFDDFGVSMINMGRIGVLTGTQGEIRKVCTSIN